MHSDNGHRRTGFLCFICGHPKDAQFAFLAGRDEVWLLDCGHPRRVPAVVNRPAYGGTETGRLGHTVLGQAESEALASEVIEYAPLA